MILQVDVGNTRVKWRFSDRFPQTTQIDAKSGFVSRLSEVLASASSLSSIYVASVSDRCLVEELRQRVDVLALDVPIYELESVASFGSIRLGYESPETMGVDRALALLAAHEMSFGDPLYKGALVLDAGTALTADFIDADGLHTDGYICAGYSMMRDSLLSNTGEIKQGFELGDSKLGLMSTAYCVNQGVSFAFLSTITKFIEVAKERELEVYLTGGDASIIMNALEGASVKWVSDLVLDGIGAFASFDLAGRN